MWHFLDKGLSTGRAWTISGRAVVVGLLTLAGAGMAAGLAYRWQKQDNAAYAAERFDMLVRRVTQEVDTRMLRYEYGLRGARGAVVAAGEASGRAAFSRYSSTRDITQEFPGARGFGFISRVSGAQEAAFVKRARTDGWPDFRVRQMQPHQQERFVITYIEPVEKNREAVGLDVASEPMRREAALTSMRSGRAALTGPITLVQARGNPAHGFLLMLPVYRPGQALDTQAAREQAANGWTYAPLLIDEVLKGLDVEAGHFVLRLRDRHDAAATWFYDTDPAAQATPSVPTRELALPIFGRQWEVQLLATPAFVDSLKLPPPEREALEILLLGLVCAGLAMAVAQLAHRARSQRLEQARRAAIVEGSDDAIVVQQLDGVITDWNDGAQRLFGFDAGEVLGRRVADLLLPGGLGGEDESMLATVSRGERVKTFETVRLHRDGTLIEVSISAAPIHDADGRCVGLAKTLRDVREARAAERRVRELNASLEDQVRERTALLERAQRDNAALLQTLHQHAIVSVADRAGRIIEVNEAFCRISGYAREELIGQNHRLVNSASHEPAFWHAMWRTISRGCSWRGEVCNRAKDGSLYWADSVVAPFLDAEGRVEKYVSIRTDITDRKRTELELQRTLTLLRTVLEASTQVSVVATDAQGVVTVFNKGAELLLGYRTEEVVGQANSTDFLEPGQMHQHAEALSARLGKPVDARLALVHEASLNELRHWTFVRKDGSRVPVSLAVTRMTDERGELIGYLGISHDISARLAQERSLREAMQQARQANEAKSRFLANMSHEIRTPMNAVIGLSYLLAKTRLDVEQGEMLGRIQLASKSLLAIINDVLDLSKIEAGEMSLECAPFDLHGLVQEVASLMSVQAQQKGIAFVVDAGDPLPGMVEGDSTRLRQVLINLLSNALKFTERGQVRLSLRQRADGPRHVALDFAIADTGIGIEPQAQSRLFEPFVQADASTTRRFGGTGLGLSIVRQLVDLMGGRIGVKSERGVGSEFSCALRMRLSETDACTVPEALPAGAGLNGLRLLLVDDNPVNRDVARRILEGEGAHVQEAGNGQEAIDCLQQQPQAFDAVLMDVQMPVLDGLDATRHIRGTLGLTALPIIGLTAGVSLSEQQRARTAGMDEVVGKPFDPPVLVGHLHRMVRGAVVAPLVRAVQRELPAEWPRLPGFDPQASFRRLNGDVALFHRLLAHLLSELQALPSARADLAPAARRLHDIKGMAGTLGADGLHALAAEAEAACRAGDAARAEPLLDRMSLAAGPLQMALPAAGAPSEREDGPGQRPVSADELRHLIERLADHDLAALALFDERAGALRALLGRDAVAAVRRHLDQLEFRAARDLLDQAQGMAAALSSRA